MLFNVCVNWDQRSELNFFVQAVMCKSWLQSDPLGLGILLNLFQLVFSFVLDLNFLARRSLVMLVYNRVLLFGDIFSCAFLQFGSSKSSVFDCRTTNHLDSKDVRAVTDIY